MADTMLRTYIISMNPQADPKKGTIILSFLQVKKQAQRAKKPAKNTQLLGGKWGDQALKRR